MGEAESIHMTELVGSEAFRLHELLSGLSQEGWLSPSACSGWTVGDVAAHLTQGAHTWRENISRARAGDSSAPPGQRPLRPGERGSEVTARQAVDLREEKGQRELLRDFADGYSRLTEVLRGLRPEDWDRPCFHRRGPMPIRDYVGVRVQELIVHGWDIRWAFDEAAEPSGDALGVLLRMVPRWLTNTFSGELAPAQATRYRFQATGPLPVDQDVLVEAGTFKIEPAAGTTAGRDADVTFRSSTGNYLLWIYGRLDLEQAVESGRLEVDGDREVAARFSRLFPGV